MFIFHKTSRKLLLVIKNNNKEAINKTCSSVSESNVYSVTALMDSVSLLSIRQTDSKP